MNQVLINQVKKAREYSYLGMYKEAENNYKEAIINAKKKYQENRKLKEQKISDMYQKLYAQLKKERSKNMNLIYIIDNAELPPKPQIERKEKNILPFNKVPFQFHHDPRTHSNDDYNKHHNQDFRQKYNNNNSIDNFQAKPMPKKSRFQNERAKRMNYNPMNRSPQNNQYMGNNNNSYNNQYLGNNNNGYGGGDFNYVDNFNNKYPNPHNMTPNIPGVSNNFPPQQPYKDPMVWEPLSPKKKKSKNKKRKNSKIKPKREYAKPWEINDKKDKKGRKNKELDEEKKKFIYSIYPDGHGPDQELIENIENYLMTKNPGITFDDIAGLEKAKESLKISILCPLLMKNFFTKIRKPPKGILLYGPAGTGKTMLAKAIATTGKTNFFSVNPAALASKWKGTSEKLVKYLFEMARFYAPTTIFIDEIDSLLSERSQNEHESSRKVKVQFFIEIDGITSSSEEEQPKVFILAATNRPWDLDEAILRRLSKRIYIPLPDDKARESLFNIKLANVKLADDIDMKFLVKKTKMYNSDDIENVCREAALAPFKRRMQNFDNQSTQFFENLEKELLTEEIKMEDFKNALINVKSSASIKFLAQYEDWTKKHSSN